MTLPATSADMSQQAVDYTTVINACKAVSRCVGIVRFSLPRTFRPLY